MTFYTPPAVLAALGLQVFQPAAGTGAFLINPPFAMTSNTYTIIDEYTATGSRLNVTARHGPFGSWLVDFVLRSSWRKQLDQCAAWLPAGHWNTSRWHPLDKRQVRPEVLARVEAWLRDRSVAREVQP
jgi:hypothetical protein